jgi:hypothetical protein
MSRSFLDGVRPNKKYLQRAQAQMRRGTLVAVVSGRAVAVNRVKEFVLASHSLGKHEKGRRCKALALQVEMWKHGAPVARFVVRSGFGQRLRTRLATQDQAEAVEMYNSI